MRSLPHNTRHRRTCCTVLALAALGAFASPMARADKTKADNTTPLNDPASWTAGTTVPGPTEIAVFDSTLVNNFAFNLGDNSQSWAGIKLTNVAADLTILAGPTLTLGDAGIDMAADANRLFLDCSINLAASQTWNASSSLIVSQGTVNLGSNVLTIQGGGTDQINSTIAGNGTLTYAGSNSIFLSGTNSFSGGLVVLGGGVTLNASSSAGTGPVTLNGGTLFAAPVLPNSIVAGGFAVINETNNTGTITFSGGFSGAGTLSIPGGTNLFNGASGQFAGFSGLLAFTTNGSAILETSGDHQAGNASIDLGSGIFTLSTRDGGTQSIGALSGGTNTTLRGASSLLTPTTFLLGGANLSTTFAGAILDGTGGAGSITNITKTGTGTLSLTGNTSHYSGDLAIQNGTLEVAYVSALGTSTDPVVLGTSSSPATFSYVGTTANSSRTFAIASAGTIESNAPGGSLTLSNTGAITWQTSGAPRTLTLAGSNSNVNTFTQKITDNGTPAAGPVSLIKSGPGTWLVKAAASSFSGGTSVNGGLLLTMNTAGNTPLGNGPVSINASAAFGGTGVTPEPVTVNSGGHLQPGIPGLFGGMGTMYFQNLSLSSGSNLDFEFSTSPASNDQIAFTAGGSLSVAGPVQVNLFQSGTTTPFSSPGTYTLLNGLNFSTGFFGSLANFQVSDPLPAEIYQFSVLNNPGANTGNLVLSITPGASQVTGTWLGAAAPPFNSYWSQSANWQSGIPGSHAGDSAIFGPAGPGGTIALTTPQTLGSISFSPGTPTGSYSLIPGDNGSLILGNGTSPASITVTGGSHSISAPTTFTNGLNVSLAAGSSLSLTAALAGAGSLSLSGAGTLAFLPSSGTAKIGDLFLAVSTTGAYAPTLDLADNTLIVEATDPTDKTAQIASLRAAIQSAKSIGPWTGAGITSSTVAQDAATATGHTYHTTLAIADNAGFLVPFITFGGQSVDANSILVTRTLVGDGDFNNTVNNADLVILLTHYGLNNQTQSGGDYDGNGTVDNADLVALLTNYGQSLPGSFSLAPANAASPTAQTIPVPEPASLALAMLAVPFFLRRRAKTT